MRRTAVLFSALCLLVGASLALSSCVAVPTSTVQEKSDTAGYPNQALHWIVATPPGGGYDTLVRGLAPSVSETLGVPVVVENYGRTEGYNTLFRAKPDGYTIGIVDPVGEYATKILLGTVYDVEKYTWLGRINSTTNVVLASPSSGFRKVEDMRKSQKPIRLGVFGFSVTTIQGISVMNALGIPISMVKFEGPAEMKLGLMRGDADIGVLGIAGTLSDTQAGSVVPVLVLSEERDSRHTQVESLGDVGIPEVAALTAHRGIAAPPELPEEIRQKLGNALEQALKSQAAQEFFTRGKHETDSLWGKDFDQVLETMKGTIRGYEPMLKEATQGL